jgi:hypothetical protein
LISFVLQTNNFQYDASFFSTNPKLVSKEQAQFTLARDHKPLSHLVVGDYFAANQSSTGHVLLL